MDKAPTIRVRPIALKQPESLSEMQHEALSLQWLTTLPRTKIDYRSEVGDGTGSSVIMAPVQWIMRVFPEAPPALERDSAEGMEPDPDAELLRLMASPNDGYSGDLLWMATVLSYLLDGNAYWIKVRDSLRRVVQLWYAPHWLIEPKWPQTGSVFISHYEYQPAGRGLEIPPEDVVHFRFGINPNHTRKGLSPLASVFREVFTDEEASNFTASLLRNMGVPGLVVSPEGDVIVEEPEAETIKQKLKRLITGDRRGEPVVLSAKTKLDQFGFNPQQLDLGNIRDIAEERVCAALGVPASVVGFGTGLQQTKVGATMREQIRLAWTGGIIPMQRLLASEIQRSLVPEFEPDPNAVRFFFDLANVQAMQEDEQQRASRFGQLVRDRIITVAEARSELGFDVDESHEIFLEPIAILPVPAGESSGAVRVSTEEGAGQLAEAAASRRLLLAAGRKQDEPTLAERIALERAPRARATREQVRLIARLDRSRRRLEEPFAADLVKLYDEIGRAGAAAARDVLEPKQELEEVIAADEIVERMNFAALDAKMRKLYEGQYLRVLDDAFDALEQIVGLAVDLRDPIAARVLEHGGRRLGLVDLKRQTHDRLFRELVEGRLEGEGPPQLVRRIRDGLPAGPWRSPQIRARVVARTETLHAQRISTLETYRDAETVAAVMVFDARLGPTDEVCEELNGAIVSVDEAEALAADEHPNGTRSFAPVIRGSQRAEEAGF